MFDIFMIALFTFGFIFFSFLYIGAGIENKLVVFVLLFITSYVFFYTGDTSYFTYVPNYYIFIISHILCVFFLNITSIYHKIKLLLSPKEIKLIYTILDELDTFFGDDSEISIYNYSYQNIIKPQLEKKLHKINSNKLLLEISDYNNNIRGYVYFCIVDICGSSIISGKYDYHQNNYKSSSLHGILNLMIKELISLKVITNKDAKNIKDDIKYTLSQLYNY